MTNRFNTIAGWVLFAGIVALGFSVLSGMYFNADKPQRPEQLGYVIEGAEEDGAAEAGPSLAMLLDTGSADAGEAVFAKCSSCHTVEQGGATGIGPNLYGVIGQPIGKHVAGFAYSDALTSRTDNWTYENLDEWFTSPRNFAPGTKMSFAGLSSPEDRANLILYLHEFGGGPAFPVPAEPESADDAEAAADGEEADGEEAAGEPAEEPVGDEADESAAAAA